MNVDGMALFMSIIKIVIVPVVLGLVIRKAAAKYMDTILALVPATTIFAIVTVTLVVVALNVKLLQGCGTGSGCGTGIVHLLRFGARFCHIQAFADAG